MNANKTKNAYPRSSAAIILLLPTPLPFEKYYAGGHRSIPLCGSAAEDGN
jgi:hypothetical protein